MKKLFLIALLSALPAFASPAFAQIDDQSKPQALIQTATQQVLNEVRSRAVAPDDIPRITAIVNRDILPYTDLRRTTQLAMGRYWRTATPEQQDQIIEQFKILLIHTYAGAIAQLRPDQQIAYPPSRFEPTETDVVVRTVALDTASGQPVQIDYRLHKTPQGWRVYDLNVMGAWLVQTYRQQFNEIIQQGGVEGLLRSLTERNRLPVVVKQ
ncbi:MlaC/ttg2D family ABC transporter substrate-binding protein [Cupriavidus basilensis]|uniref:MlaC/ttg2D family ABC transporter substrate-binding protein n=1 Tax=Cupriavidus basilensis TaxID=68895 RepID=UPI000751855E|nr:ABC transporter substrate-binding protein [Cupriavidus basilensis]